MIKALEEDHPEAAELLLLNNADPNAKGNFGEYALKLAAIKGYSQVVRLLLERGAEIGVGVEYSPLHYAAYNGHRDVAILLISAGADVNARDNEGRTPLHEAAEQGQTDVVKLLLESGADPKVRDAEGRLPRV